jgi:hypothetical protein
VNSVQNTVNITIRQVNVDHASARAEELTHDPDRTRDRYGDISI